MPKTNENTIGKSSIASGGIEKLNRTRYAKINENKQMPMSMKKMIHRGMFR